MHQVLKFIFRIKLHVLNSFSVNHQEFFTVRTAGSGWKFPILLTSCHQTCMKYSIAVCKGKNC